ncbi:MAG: hypothetical protein H7837_02185 [Magnetococcus sp. MYC-9]
MTTLRVFLVCCALWLGGFSGVAHAFSLGELQLLSKPGQPFQATAAVKLGKEEEISSVSIGSASDYALLNLPHVSAVEALTAQIKEQPGGPVIWLQSSTPIQESDFFILLRVSSNQHTFFPFFRLHSAAAGAKQEPPKNDKPEVAKKSDPGGSVRPVNQKPRNEAPAQRKEPPPSEEGQPIDRATLEKMPFFAMADKALGSIKLPPPDNQPVLPPSATQEALPGAESVALPAATEPAVPADAPPAESKKSPPPAPKKTASRQPSPLASAATPPSPEIPGQRTQYGPVKEGENLSEIVQQLHLVTGNVSFFQAVASIWKQNPGMFIRNNMNGLKTGVTLTIPAAQEMSQVEIQEARRLRLGHGLEWQKPSHEQQDMPIMTASATEQAKKPLPATSAKGEETAPHGGATSDSSGATPGGGSGASALPSTPTGSGTVSMGGAAAPAPAPPPPAAKSTTAEGVKGEREELGAILTQLQVITRVLESNQAQQDRLEKRLSTLEQARKEWDFLRERITELERTKEAVQRAPAATDEERRVADPAPTPVVEQPNMVWWIGGGVAAVLALGLLLLWLARRWNQVDRWKSLQALLTATAREDPQLLREALQQSEPAFGQEFVPATHNQKLEGVSPSVQKRSVAGDVAETASKLKSMAG